MPKMALKAADSGWQLRFQQVSGATLALIITGTLARVITLLTQMVIAREFGISILSDAFFVAQNVPELFYEFLAAGFSLVFIPLFAKYRLSQGKEEAWRFASGFLYLSGLVSLVLAVITAAGSSFVVGLLAPGFDDSARQVADMLVRIMALSIIFLGLEAGLRGLLHSYRDFIIPEIARLVFNGVLFGIAWSLSRQFGVLILGWGVV
ncbi:MAG: lipid II flippase MurJ, partial [Anaerolineae bacterium]|nr:lipid II flippase MurJ [Anaerolineae bacterium]